LILGLFLGLVFLLGVFPLNDTDFWWHLKTGDLIRATGQVPRADAYTFGAEGRPWIDLHWGFQVLVSWLYGWGGSIAVNLGKCVITTIALGIFLLARPRTWPLWVVVLAWLPALLLLSGRMYVRPEMLTLAGIMTTFAILMRWRDHPWLAWILPVMQLGWVNVHGLFVFGLILVGLALVDTALDAGMWMPARRGWWRIVIPAVLLQGLACVVNPYGLAGALYPLQLFGTMNNPVFGDIAELQSIPGFIKEAGWRNPALGLHFTVLGLGVLSFVMPAVGWLWGRVKSAVGRVSGRREEVRARGQGQGKGQRTGQVEGKPRAREGGRRKQATARPPLIWFRVILFGLISWLSFKATRNSHQFAAIAGGITAWNLGEWAAGFRSGARSQSRRKDWRAGHARRSLATAGVLAAVIVLVGSGAFYGWLGEGRTVGLGEKPLWFPHDAVRAAGAEGMPLRCVAFHNGHAALYEYVHAPERKVYLDARLEVIGPEKYQEYRSLKREIGQNAASWNERVRGMRGPDGFPPCILVDQVFPEGSEIAATLFTHPEWRLMHHDPVAAVFVHRSVPIAARGGIDFARLHFGRAAVVPETDPAEAALLAEAKALRNVANMLMARGFSERARSLILRGYGLAREAARGDPGLGEAWKYVGQLELMRGPAAPTARRLADPWDAATDLGSARALHALREAARLAPGDFTTHQSLFAHAQGRGIKDLALEQLEILVSLPGINRAQRGYQAQLQTLLPELRQAVAAGKQAGASWENRAQLEELVGRSLAGGCPGTAADHLEAAFSADARTWPVADRIATLRLLQGEPLSARRVWLEAKDVPRPALRKARIAACDLILLRDEEARAGYEAALADEPELFEALLGLGYLERDSGRASAALAAAERALAAAGTDHGRAAATALLREVAPYPSGGAPAAAAGPSRSQ
jgi:tetratricopeptide (TPR) repeat protein